MGTEDGMNARRLLRRFWPWLVLLLTLIPAVWHVVDFDEDLDVEFPNVIRPTFSRVPAAAYRLAEPGDTLDRIMIYFSAAGLVMAASGLALSRGGGCWPAAIALAAGALWYSGTPGPTFDGWYGLGWRSIANPDAPAAVRAGLLAAAIAIGGVIGGNLWVQRRKLRDPIEEAHRKERAAHGVCLLRSKLGDLIGRRIERGRLVSGSRREFWPCYGRWRFLGSSRRGTGRGGR